MTFLQWLQKEFRLFRLGGECRRRPTFNKSSVSCLPLSIFHLRLGPSVSTLSSARVRKGRLGIDSARPRARATLSAAAARHFQPPQALPHALSPRVRPGSFNTLAFCVPAADCTVNDTTTDSRQCRARRSTSRSRPATSSPSLPPRFRKLFRRLCANGRFARLSASRHGYSTSQCALRCPSCSQAPTLSPSSP